MEKISYTDRICTDEKRINEFLAAEKSGILSILGDDGKPYGVPVNYLYWNNKIYFHGKGSGKKFRSIEKNGDCTFSIFREDHTISDENPCKCDTAYFSVIAHGKAGIVEEISEKVEALQRLTDKLLPDYFKEKMTERFVEKCKSSSNQMPVAVFAIEIEQLSVKEN